jgi:hypothetical protein
MLKIKPCKSNVKTMKHMRSLNGRVKRGIHQAARNARPILKRHVDKKMAESKSGRTYRVYVGQGGRPLKKPRIHVASSLNEMPAILTGNLRRSISFTIKHGISLTFGANTPYARRWEKSGRSYLRKTINDKRKDVKDELEQQIERALR